MWGEKMISMIACVGKNGELGLNGQLLFHIKEDMAFFRKTTLGQMVVMGRKTWESLPKRLEGRCNAVVSHHFTSADVNISNLEDFLSTRPDCFIIGGGTLYTQALSYADIIYLTEVDREAKADTFFPEFDRSHRTILEQGKGYTISKYVL